MSFATGTVRMFTEDNGKEISMGVRKAGDVLSEIGACASTSTSRRCARPPEPNSVFCAKRSPRLVRNKEAATFLSSYTAIRTAGGVVSRLFDLKGKVDQSELARLVGSIGIKRMEAGATVLAQGSRRIVGFMWCGRAR